MKLGVVGAGIAVRWAALWAKRGHANIFSVRDLLREQVRATYAVSSTH